jgi:hypothetical protein
MRSDRHAGRAQFAHLMRMHHQVGAQRHTDLSTIAATRSSRSSGSSA